MPKGSFELVLMFGVWVTSGPMTGDFKGVGPMERFLWGGACVGPSQFEQSLE
jgi:hypothetical protein